MLSALLSAVISSAFHSLNKSYSTVHKRFIEDGKIKSFEDTLLNSIYKNTFNSRLHIQYWHSASGVPPYIKTRLDKLSISSKPGFNTAVLELLDTELSIFIRATNKSYRYQGTINKSALMAGSIKAWLSPEPLGNLLILAKPSMTFLKDSISEIAFKDSDLLQAKNILANPSLELESNPQILVPIRDHYLLYTTSTNILRRISLISSENQPILEGVILEGEPPNSCFIKLEKSKVQKQISCANDQGSLLARLHAIDL